MKYKLAIIPEGYKVVPEEPTDEQLNVIRDNRDYGATAWEIYTDAINASPPINMPPVLRWEGEYLYVFGVSIIRVYQLYQGAWVWRRLPHDTLISTSVLNTEQEARHAAEKALGFTDGLVVDVV